ncbi:hypothetical protein KKH23_04300, partial [Patescibacteria group bacterium]|nr:hypothetical protein [Patescibacteria group bacterium]
MTLNDFEKLQKSNKKMIYHYNIAVYASGCFITKEQTTDILETVIEYKVWCIPADTEMSIYWVNTFKYVEDAMECAKNHISEGFVMGYLARIYIDESIALQKANKGTWKVSGI